jgi:hypothetical protein
MIKENDRETAPLTGAFHRGRKCGICTRTGTKSPMITNDLLFTEFSINRGNYRSLIGSSWRVTKSMGQPAIQWANDGTLFHRRWIEFMLPAASGSVLTDQSNCTGAETTNTLFSPHQNFCSG